MPLDQPFQAAGTGTAVLRGNLAPDGAVIKQSAASPHLLKHRGRALVFDSPEAYHQVAADPDLEVDEDTVLIIRYCGPKGYPGMPETANVPLPAKLLKRGVRDIVRICDGRMSGTAYGTVVLHVAPEAAAGGPSPWSAPATGSPSTSRPARSPSTSPTTSSRPAAPRGPRRRGPPPGAGPGFTPSTCSRPTPAATSISSPAPAAPRSAATPTEPGRGAPTHPPAPSCQSRPPAPAPPPALQRASTSPQLPDISRNRPWPMHVKKCWIVVHVIAPNNPRSSSPRDAHPDDSKKRFRAMGPRPTPLRRSRRCEARRVRGGRQ